MDLDLVFFDSAEHLWMEFENMNSSQMVGMVQEPPFNWNQWWRDRQKVAGKYGANAGVMLMNLAKMREFKWVEKVLLTYQSKTEMINADQGVINIILNENPGMFCKRTLIFHFYFLPELKQIIFKEVFPWL